MVRQFGAAGWRVIVAESLPIHLAHGSRYLHRSYAVPAPRFDPLGYVAALTTISQQEGVSLLIPTCEEVFHIAAAYDVLSAHCTVFSEPLARLIPLHSKAAFIALARSFGLAVPDTHIITNVEQAHALLGEPIVLKPEYSRFATQTIIRPRTAHDLIACDASPTRRWVAQTYLEGRQVCSYSIAHNGRLTAHAVYATEYTAGRGATIAFRPLDYPQVRAWVTQFVGAYGYTGQIAFDFIESDQGVMAIECNPRAISGLHLLAGSVVEAIIHPDADYIEPSLTGGSAVKLALVVYGYGAQIGEWWTLRDVVWRVDDLLPALMQVAVVGQMAWRAVQQGSSLIGASTWDIEWNGE
jgi:hypothetical protein